MDKKLIDKLVKRENEGTLRSLSFCSGMIDFFSNDYLGFASRPTAAYDGQFSSTGSRLISGNSSIADECERFLASRFDASAALIFNSGYDANLGFFSSVPQKGDTVVYDAYVHASIRDGIRLSFASAFSFKHNDLEDLRHKLSRAAGTIYIAVEGIYSMSGDQAPLLEIVRIAKEYGAYIYLDEAHSAGVLGENGAGLAVELGIADGIYARLVTFGKAFGAHGACILSSENTRNYLINFAHSFIYTTALPPEQYVRIMEILRDADLETRRMNLHKNCQLLNEKLGIERDENSPILMLGADNRKQLSRISSSLNSAKFAVKPIFHPTVPLECEGIRISMHAFNTADEIDSFASQLIELRPIQF
jgi:8-amino-7-oxononanoate synthase